MEKRQVMNCSRIGVLLGRERGLQRGKQLKSLYPVLTSWQETSAAESQIAAFVAGLSSS